MDCCPAAIDGNDWRNPDVLTLIAGAAQRIELREGENQETDLHLQRVPY